MQRSPVRVFGRVPRILPCIAFAISVLLLTPALALAQGNGKLQIHHMMIGQGDGILLISPNGQTALFDDGVYTNCTYIKSYLQGLGIASVTYHFLSHYHADHLGCIDDLAAVGITIGVAGYDRGYSYSSASYTSYVNTLGPKRQTIAQNQVITLDAGAANPVTVRCVNLNGAGVYDVGGSDENAKTAVYKVTYGAFDEVIGGDLTGDAAGGKDVETTVGPQVGDVEVYKVHHHGSRYSTNDNWLAATTPEVGIIQVGTGNSYGHPTADAVDRMHARSVKTYWTETGAGATPNPSWDTVANGTVLVTADPGASDSYTVSGPGFSHTYPNGGAPPPPPTLTATETAETIAVLQGSISAGDVTRLAADDALRVSVSAGVAGNKYATDWYGSVLLDHPPLSLTVTYDGNFTVSRTQTLHLWNWTTGAWDQIQSSTVGTTDVLVTHTPASHSPYVSAAREVRFRVKGNNRSSTYTSRGDWMTFRYDYTQGTAPSLATGTGAVVAAIDPHAGHALDPERAPQSVLHRLDVEPCVDGVALVWATGIADHADGFNLYRENASGTRTHVPGEAAFAIADGEVEFRFVDASADAGGVYWLGARGCSGVEGLIGPIRVAAGAASKPLAFTATPSPAREGTTFDFTLAQDGMATIDVFDLSGRRVATPFSGWMKAGAARAGWSLTDRTGQRLNPGIYFARLQTVDRTLVRRIVIGGN